MKSKSVYTLKTIFDKWVTNREELTNKETDYKAIVIKIQWASCKNRHYIMEQETGSTNEPRHILGFPIL